MHTSSGSTLPLEISPDPVILTADQAGGPAVTSLEVRNVCNSSVMLETIETSCPCILVAPVPLSIGAHEVRSLDVSFAPSSDDEAFEDSLSIEVIGRVLGGGIGFRTRVTVTRGFEL